MSRARARLAALTLAATGLVPAAGCAARAETGSLRWERPPRVIRPPTLPRDRILTGRLRNDGLQPIDLRARDVRLVDVSGRPVDGARPLFI